MINIGIDISLDSTGIVASGGDKNHYVSLLNSYKITKDKKKLASIPLIISDNKILRDLSKIPNFTQEFYHRKPSSVKTSDLQIWHRSHMDFCTEISNKMSAIIESLLKKFNDDATIKIEYYSYGSIKNGGSASVQIIEATSAIKQAIIKNGLCDMDNLVVIPGPAVKQFVGGGNFQKFDMLQAYIEQNLKGDEFFDYISRNFIDLYNTKVKGKGSVTENVVVTPIDDIIDAYWIAKCK